MKNIATIFILSILFLAAAHRAIAQYTNIQVNNPLHTTPEEVTIAINPTNPLNLAAGANISYSYYSTDGGLTWNEQYLSSSYGVWGDPSVTFDALGNLYFGHLSNPPHPAGYWIDRIVVQQSTDDGQTWDDGIGLGYSPPRKNQDKEWLAADCTTSPYRNNVYVAWTEFDAYGSANPTDSSRILFSRSTDVGGSWSTPIRVSDTGGNCLDGDSTVEGAVPAIGPNGEVYLSWGGPLGIMFDKSTDGGVTFGTDVFVTSQPGGWDFGIPGIYRANGMPVTACDVSPSPYRGNIYIQWSDQRNGIDNTDIFFIKSTDQGATWGPVIQVNNDTSKHHQFFSWMTVDQTTGNICVVFYDRRNTTDSATEVYVATSHDGGETFANTKVSNSPFTPRADVFFGDYTNIAASAGKIYPIWMRLDNRTLSVWTTIMHNGYIVDIPIASGWNMVSLPVIVDDHHPGAIFSSSFITNTSTVFRYSAGYVTDTLMTNGAGYWIKSPSIDTIHANGSPLEIDTINLSAKWNMVGSLSKPVAAASISSLTPGLITSPFFHYTRLGYVQADTIKPGFGYWVKASQSGKIVLATGSIVTISARVKIITDGEQPPPPPSFLSRNTLPTEYALKQNYPNPFNPSTVIEYQLPQPEFVTLKVYNILGQEIATLVNAREAAGYKSVKFEISNLSSGVYIYSLTAGTFFGTKKMLLIR
ncbi:MAG: T9SS type A sorting domain-containing protein [Bacteroidota bacterium]